MKFKQKFAGILTGMAIAVAGAAQAQGWAPDGTLRLQIGFGAGGETDTIGRVIADVMKEQTGWNIIAENKPGGGGIAMFTAISKMPADGTVIGMGVNMPIAVNLATQPDQLAFGLDDLAYLGTVARAQLAIVAKKDAPFDDFEGMISYAKDNGGLTIAFDAPPQKFIIENIEAKTEAGFRLVSADGAAEAEKFVLGGQVDAGFSAGSHIKYLESGDFKMIAAVNADRHNYAPDIKTLRESGYDLFMDPYFFIAAGANTPPEAQEALAAALADAIASEEVAEVVRNVTVSDPVNLGPEATRTMLDESVENQKTVMAK